VKKKEKKQPKDTTSAIAAPEKVNPLQEAPEAKVSDSVVSLDTDPTVSAPLAITPSVSRFRRLLPDFIKVVVALIIILFAVAILLTPPLLKSDFPRVSYIYNGTTYTNAVLYRPLAMPTRYYIQLPEKLAGRYRCFAVDRRREVAALMTNTLTQTFFGFPAVKRSEPLGMDLEFRHLDDSVWNVSFLPETILFSNAVLTVRLDIK
jgi:hypothetical protein